MNQQIVFESGEKFYRIPALICLQKKESKILLAFAEQRRTSKDETAEKLVMKKGEVNSSGKTVKWSELKVVEKAHLDKHRPMNPCPVYDKVKETLFLFFICVEDGVDEDSQKKNYQNKAQPCYITSTDFGETWSDVIELRDKLSDIQAWATFAFGPGHGIQTESNRLIIPVNAYCSSCINSVWCWCCRTCCVSCLGWCCRKCYRDSWCNLDSYALSLYSDDYGDSWKFGKMFETKSGECQMAEISKEKIYCSARSTNKFRVETFSDDNGINFSKDKSAQKLVEVHTKSVLGCQGSVISFPASDQSSDKWLLFTHPTGPGRMKLGVYLNKSPSDPKAWSEPKVINNGPSGYSDLAYIDDGWFACLFECGKQDIHEQIAFVTFTEDVIKKNIPG
ncbi:sialidase-4-like [Archocentrus centrarchus]|uniref:sialidase-4-like n=1 Tax=Archocentrus centrarchus TaxID=63155 RepID=UPI0011EA029D|nr:sialidase-4-like [Archocentrus centrarchus]